MIEHITLINFKIARQLPLDIGSLNLLAGMNGAGKSTIMQAIASVRQSYLPDGSTSGFLPIGDLVQLGKGKDVLTEGAENDSTSISIIENDFESEWTFNPLEGSNRFVFTECPRTAPEFVKTNDFQFLKADRITPNTLYPQSGQMGEEVGFLGVCGEYTADFLATFSGKTVSDARHYSSSKLEISNSNIALIEQTPKLSDQVAAWLQQVSPGVKFETEIISGTDEVKLSYRYLGRVREASTNHYRPTNVGFGITYCLPIIVAALSAPKGGLLMLENPEAHLHPKGQSALGYMLAMCAGDGVQIIVETHSDHVLNGIRLAVKRNLIDAQKVKVHFFERIMAKGEAEVTSLKISQNGRIEKWPIGFFDQIENDLSLL
jgi:predicted ATPase